MSTNKQNVFVGISLQNKGLKDQDFKNILKCAKDSFNFKKLIFLIADGIELINQRVFVNGHEKNHIRNVSTQAKDLESLIINSCQGEDLKTGRVLTCRWNDILDSGYWSCFFEIQRIFYSNSLFRGDVTYAINEYAKRRKKTFGQAETLYLCQYVLHEIPTLLYGIRVKDKQYSSMIYPAPVNASIDKICNKLVSEKYGMTLFEPPFCSIQKYKIPIE